MAARMIGSRVKRLSLAAGVLALLAACGPEAGRPRSGGLGADPGNHARGEIPKSKVFNTGAGGAESGAPDGHERLQPEE